MVKKMPLHHKNQVLFMEQNIREKIERTQQFMLALWTIFLIILYVCSFLAEYHFPGEREEMAGGEKILSDLQKLFFFALMGVGFLIDLVRMRKDKNNAFVFLLLSQNDTKHKNSSRFISISRSGLAM